MELGLTIPLQRLLKIKNLSYGKENGWIHQQTG